MPGQQCISECDDSPVPSLNVMVHNDCDISTKENNPSVIESANSQVNTGTYTSIHRYTSTTDSLSNHAHE